ncbi:hypothetical protein D3OALGB2SA_251 [Olavius algarvensis associated proteobacterium Delta 3]|nr:hypothetical protein D3OALGB2SA_251 [Olavius algarvensis associated proteobacterium Delta 3]
MRYPGESGHFNPIAEKILWDAKIQKVTCCSGGSTSGGKSLKGKGIVLSLRLRYRITR